MKAKSTLRSFLLAAGSSLLAISSAQAVTYYWDTNETASGFGTATLGSLGTWAAPTASRWTTATDTTTATDVNRTILIGDSVNFGDATNGLGAGTITVSSTVDATGITFGAKSGEIVLSGGIINLAATATITVNNATDTISSQITGAATSLTKAGSGKLVLSGDSTRAGTTLITAGVLNIQHATALGAIAGSTTVSNNATLEMQGGITVGAEALSLTGIGASSNGALRNISGSNTYGGAITLAGNTRIYSDAGLLTLDVASGSAITGTNRVLTFGGAGDITVADAITNGTGTLTKLGGGVLKLTGVNAYTGTTTVFGGTLDLGGSGATGSLTSTTLTLAGGAFHYTRTGSATQSFTTTNFNAVTSSISVTSAGSILNLGTVVRATGVTFDFTTGSGIVAALAANNVGGIMPGFTLGNSWAVANGAGNAITALGTYTATTGLASNAYAGNIDVDSINATPDAAITVNSLRFSEGAANVLTLSGSNTITTGGILVSSDVGNNLSTIAGGTLVGAASKDLSVIQKNTLNSLTISSIIADNTAATALAKSGAGTLILSGANSYTGTTAINLGTLQVNSGGTLGAITAPLTMGTGSEEALGTVGNLTLNTSAQVGAFTVKSNTSDTTTPSNINQLSIASGSTLTASSFTAGIAVAAANYFPTNTALSTGSTPGAGGTLTVNGTTAIGQEGPADYLMSTTVVDLRGLHTFTNTGALNVGKGRNSKAALYLANNANTINGAISVGDSVVNYNYAGVSHLYLGAGTNALQAATITLGLNKGAGQILFAGPSGSVTITGAGGSGKSAITIGNNSQSSYQGTAPNSLLLAGHTATVSASTVIIGTVTGSGSGGNTMDNLLTFDTGTFNADSITMGEINTSATTTNHPTIATFTVGGDTANSSATGIVNVSGNILLGNHDDTGYTGSVSGTLTINGGTVNVNTTAATTGGIYDGSSSATASSRTSTLTLAGGTLDLNGGRIGGTGTDTGSVGMKNIDNLNFQSGTLIDVRSINGSAGLTKTTSGTLNIAGTNSWTGATLVNEGRLNVTGTMTSAVTVASGAILSGTGTTTLALSLDNGSTIVGTTAGSSFQANTVTATSAVNIAGSNGNGTPGTYTIGVVRYATGTGPTTGNFSTAGYRSASVANVGGAGGETRLTYTNEARKWDSASATWDAMTTNAWQAGGTDTNYSQGDAVTFDDTGTGGGSARAVTLNSLVTPGSVTFNNSTSTPYTVSGTGTIAGLTGLTKSGNGTVTLSNANTYTGATTISAGTLRINGSTASGSAVSVAALATLGGNGLVGGATTFTGASVHAPGSAAATVGTQAFSSTLAYGTGTIFEWDINVDGTTSTYDKVTAAGAITGSAAVFKIVLAGGDSFADAFWDNNRSWGDIFGGAGAPTNLATIFGGGFDASGGVSSGGVTAHGTFALSGTTLNWTPSLIPEPTSALAGLLLGAGLLRRRRK